MAPQDPDPYIGRFILGGRYQILEKLGSGSIGSVYKAAEPFLDGIVAVKILHRQLVHDQDALARFRHEARVMRDVWHPNVARVYAYEQLDDGLPCIVMEYVEGKNLRQMPRGEGPQAAKDAVQVAIQICGALHAAHQQGIVHGDIKPENIIVLRIGGRQDLPKVVDFGLATLAADTAQDSHLLTRTGEVFGRPEFMAPERTVGKSADARSDTYSLAVVLYEMLTGELPFEGQTIAEYIQAQHATRPIPLDARIPGKTFPVGLGDVLAKALEQNPDNRFQSAAEFAEALRPFTPEQSADGLATWRPTVKPSLRMDSPPPPPPDIIKDKRARSFEIPIKDEDAPTTEKPAIVATSVGSAGSQSPAATEHKLPPGIVATAIGSAGSKSPAPIEHKPPHPAGRNGETPDQKAHVEPSKVTDANQGGRVEPPAVVPKADSVAPSPIEFHDLPQPQDWPGESPQDWPGQPTNIAPNGENEAYFKPPPSDPEELPAESPPDEPQPTPSPLSLDTARRIASFVAEPARAALWKRTSQRVRNEAESSSIAKSSVPPMVAAYCPSWVVPRRQFTVHIHIFLPEVKARVDAEARAALDAPGNPARASHAISLWRALDENEPLIVEITLADCEIGNVEVARWRAPHIRFIVPIRAHAELSIGIHRPVVTVRSLCEPRIALATFDFVLDVRAMSPRSAMLRAMLSGGGIALACIAAALVVTDSQLFGRTAGWPVVAACLTGGATAWTAMRPALAPAELRDYTPMHLRRKTDQLALNRGKDGSPIPIGEGMDANLDAMADVLIVTAVADEYEAALQVDTGAVAGSSWDVRTGPGNLQVAFRDFTTEEGILRIAVTQALGMGGVHASTASTLLLDEYAVRCLAMCGVCAGRRGDVELGDVIIADRAWQYDAGKRQTVTDMHGNPTIHEQGDIDTYRIYPPQWIHAAERFKVDPNAAWLATRPRSHGMQGDWILDRIVENEDPASHAERSTMCNDYERVVARLWAHKHLEDGTLEPTDTGRKHIQRLRTLHGGKIPEPKPFRVYVGAMASGNKVMADGEVFSILKNSVRKVLALEMEAAAILALAHTRQLEYAVVMKAVMDHADSDKSDNFKTFAARASAECLVAFLRQHVPPRRLSEERVYPADI